MSKKMTNKDYREELNVLVTTFVGDIAKLGNKYDINNDMVLGHAIEWLALISEIATIKNLK